MHALSAVQFVRQCLMSLSVELLNHSICIHWHMERSKSILTSFSTCLFRPYCSPSQLLSQRIHNVYCECYVHGYMSAIFTACAVRIPPTNRCVTNAYIQFVISPLLHRPLNAILEGYPKSKNQLMVSVCQ